MTPRRSGNPEPSADTRRTLGDQDPMGVRDTAELWVERTAARGLVRPAVIEVIDVTKTYATGVLVTRVISSCPF